MLDCISTTPTEQETISRRLWLNPTTRVPPLQCGVPLPAALKRLGDFVLPILMLQSLRRYRFLYLAKRYRDSVLKTFLLLKGVHSQDSLTKNSLVVSGSHTTGILPTFLLTDYRHNCNLGVGNMITSIYIQIADIDKFIRIHCLWLPLLYYHLFNS